MQAVCHSIQVVIEEIGVGVECDLGRFMPEHPLQRKHVHPADTASDAHVWRRSCGVIVCTLAFLTAA